jgi:putative heme-binding domain-containing protein
LEKLARTAKLPEAKVLALHAARNLQVLGESPVRSAMRDPDARVREQALILAAPRFVFPPPTQTWPVFSHWLVAGVQRLAGDPDVRVRLQAALALGVMPRTAKKEKLLSGLGAGSNDRWLKQAVAEYTKDTNAPWYRDFFASLKPPTRPAPMPAQVDPDRARVVEHYRPALQFAGDRPRGAATFAKLCIACHYLQGHGQRVGPDLSGIASRPLDALLADVLDPSRLVTPDYTTYEVVTTTGETVTGLLASETATLVTLRHAGSPDETIARSAIKEIRASGKSLMPDGLENGLSVQDIADLLAFLQKPDGELLPK